MRKLSLEKEMRKKINKEKQLELFLEGNNIIFNLTNVKVLGLQCEVTSIAPNKVLCDVAVSRHFTFNLTQMFNQGTNTEFCTSPAIAQNTCYLPFLFK